MNIFSTVKFLMVLSIYLNSSSLRRPSCFFALELALRVQCFETQGGDDSFFIFGLIHKIGIYYILPDIYGEIGGEGKVWVRKKQNNFHKIQLLQK